MTQKTFVRMMLLVLILLTGFAVMSASENPVPEKGDCTVNEQEDTRSDVMILKSISSHMLIFN
ncbi:MAG: hypothetical protein H7Y27_00525 [Gemmatimonadaceae bacterium]|nr:hypothetical protein [Chitinophagaceae bacterium]